MSSDSVADFTNNLEAVTNCRDSLVRASLASWNLVSSCVAVPPDRCASVHAAAISVKDLRDELTSKERRRKASRDAGGIISTSSASSSESWSKLPESSESSKSVVFGVLPLTILALGDILGEEVWRGAISWFMLFFKATLVVSGLGSLEVVEVFPVDRAGLRTPLVAGGEAGALRAGD